MLFLVPLIPTNENVWVPDPAGNDSNSSKSAIGNKWSRFVQSYLISVLDKTSTKYDDFR